MFSRGFRVFVVALLLPSLITNNTYPLIKKFLKNQEAGLKAAPVKEALQKAIVNEQEKIAAKQAAGKAAIGAKIVTGLEKAALGAVEVGRVVSGADFVAALLAKINKDVLDLGFPKQRNADYITTTTDFEAAVKAKAAADKKQPSDYNIIYLEENSLPNIPAHFFNLVPGAQEIYLNNCGIQTLDPLALQGPPNSTLTILDLRGNSISTLPNQLFQGRTNLQVILTGNPITQPANIKVLNALKLANPATQFLVIPPPEVLANDIRRKQIVANVAAVIKTVSGATAKSFTLNGPALQALVNLLHNLAPVFCQIGQQRCGLNPSCHLGNGGVFINVANALAEVTATEQHVVVFRAQQNALMAGLTADALNALAQKLPPGHPDYKDVTILHINNSGLTSIPDNVLGQLFPSLEQLDLSNSVAPGGLPNNITSIGQDAFKGLTNLKLLNLETNKQLAAFPQHAIQDCINLKHIRLGSTALALTVNNKEAFATVLNALRNTDHANPGPAPVVAIHELTKQGLTVLLMVAAAVGVGILIPIILPFAPAGAALIEAVVGPGSLLIGALAPVIIKFITAQMKSPGFMGLAQLRPLFTTIKRDFAKVVLHQELKILNLSNTSLTSINDPNDATSMMQVAKNQYGFDFNDQATCDAITVIRLGENNITSIPADAFIKFLNVEAINLGGNKITTIDKDAFRNLKWLKHLYLADNLITQFPATAILNCPSLKAIYLGHNPIAAGYNLYSQFLANPKNYFKLGVDTIAFSASEGLLKQATSTPTTGITGTVVGKACPTPVQQSAADAAAAIAAAANNQESGAGSTVTNAAIDTDSDIDTSDLTKSAQSMTAAQAQATLNSATPSAPATPPADSTVFVVNKATIKGYYDAINALKAAVVHPDGTGQVITYGLDLRSLIALAKIIGDILVILAIVLGGKAFQAIKAAKAATAAEKTAKDAAALGVKAATDEQNAAAKAVGEATAAKTPGATIPGEVKPPVTPAKPAPTITAPKPTAAKVTEEAAAPKEPEELPQSKADKLRSQPPASQAPTTESETLLEKAKGPSATQAPTAKTLLEEASTPIQRGFLARYKEADIYSALKNSKPNEVAQVLDALPYETEFNVLKSFPEDQLALIRKDLGVLLKKPSGTYIAKDITGKNVTKEVVSQADWEKLNFYNKITLRKMTQEATPDLQRQAEFVNEALLTQSKATKALTPTDLKAMQGADIQELDLNALSTEQLEAIPTKYLLKDQIQSLPKEKVAIMRNQLPKMTDNDWSAYVEMNPQERPTFLNLVPRSAKNALNYDFYTQASHEERSFFNQLPDTLKTRYVQLTPNEQTAIANLKNIQGEEVEYLTRFKLPSTKTGEGISEPDLYDQWQATLKNELDSAVKKAPNELKVTPKYLENAYTNPRYLINDILGPVNELPANPVDADLIKAQKVLFDRVPKDPTNNYAAAIEYNNTHPLAREFEGKFKTQMGRENFLTYLKGKPAVNQLGISQKAHDLVSDAQVARKTTEAEAAAAAHEEGAVIPKATTPTGPAAPTTGLPSQITITNATDQAMVKDALSKMKPEDFKNLANAQKKIALNKLLNKAEKTGYAQLTDPADQLAYLQMTPEERPTFSALVHNRQAFLDMAPPEELAYFKGLSPSEQAAYVSTDIPSDLRLAMAQPGGIPDLTPTIAQKLGIQNTDDWTAIHKQWMDLKPEEQATILAKPGSATDRLQALKQLEMTKRTTVKLEPGEVNLPPELPTGITAPPIATTARTQEEILASDAFKSYKPAGMTSAKWASKSVAGKVAFINQKPTFIPFNTWNKLTFENRAMLKTLEENLDQVKAANAALATQEKLGIVRPLPKAPATTVAMPEAPAPTVAVPAIPEAPTAITPLSQSTIDAYKAGEFSYEKELGILQSPDAVPKEGQEAIAQTRIAFLKAVNQSTTDKTLGNIIKNDLGTFAPKGQWSKVLGKIEADAKATGQGPGAFWNSLSYEDKVGYLGLPERATYDKAVAMILKDPATGKAVALDDIIPKLSEYHIKNVPDTAAASLKASLMNDPERAGRNIDDFWNSLTDDQKIARLKNQSILKDDFAPPKPDLVTTEEGAVPQAEPKSPEQPNAVPVPETKLPPIPLLALTALEQGPPVGPACPADQRLTCTSTGQLAVCPSTHQPPTGNPASCPNGEQPTCPSGELPTCTCPANQQLICLPSKQQPTGTPPTTCSTPGDQLTCQPITPLTCQAGQQLICLPSNQQPTGTPPTCSTPGDQLTCQPITELTCPTGQQLICLPSNQQPTGTPPTCSTPGDQLTCACPANQQLICLPSGQQPTGTPPTCSTTGDQLTCQQITPPTCQPGQQLICLPSGQQPTGTPPTCSTTGDQLTCQPPVQKAPPPPPAEPHKTGRARQLSQQRGVAERAPTP